MANLNLYLPPELHERLRTDAEREQRSMSGHIRWLLDRELPAGDTLSPPPPTLPAAPSPPTKGPADVQP